MFDYLNEINSRLDVVISTYNKQGEEKKAILNKINLFVELENKKNELAISRISLTFWTLLLIMMFVVVSLFDINIILGTFFVLLPSLKIVQYSNEISDNKFNYENLEKKCLEVVKNTLNKDIELELSKDVIKRVNQNLYNQKCGIECSMTNTVNYMKKISTFLSLCEKDDDFDELFSNQSNKYKSDCDKNYLSMFLKEKTDYGNINFNNNIVGNIDYTENTKKLLKKL